MSRFDTVLEVAFVSFMVSVVVLSLGVLSSMPSQNEIRDVVLSIQNGKVASPVNSSKVALEVVR